jgi:hypothetical protein
MKKQVNEPVLAKEMSEYPIKADRYY